MPSDDPQIGEVWSTTDPTTGREIQGLLAELTPTRVTLVNLAGARFPVGRVRLGSLWRFVQGVPTEQLPQCQRVGCTLPGMLRWTRPTGRVHPFEYACPRHAPLGTLVERVVNPPADALTFGPECRSCPCPSCGNTEPTEDLQFSDLPCRLWVCQTCRARWVTIPRFVHAEDIPVEVQRLFVELSQRQLYADTVRTTNRDAWRAMLVDRRTGDAPQTGEAFRLVSGAQVTFEPAAINEQAREHFSAIVNVRAPLTQRQRPVQRLGGAPNQGPNPTNTPVGPQVLDQLYRPTRNVSQEAAARHQLLRQESPPPNLFEGPQRTEGPPMFSELVIEKDSLWLQKAGGMVVVVLGAFKIPDGSEAVRFRQSTADDSQPSTTMTKVDFVLTHKLFTRDDTPQVPLFEASVEEEWEHEDGTMITITEIDHRKDIIHGNEAVTGRRRHIPFAQFATKKWRKVVRRSVYDRLRNPEIDE